MEGIELKDLLITIISNNDINMLRRLVDYGVEIDVITFENSLIINMGNLRNDMLDYLLTLVPITNRVVSVLSHYMKYKQLKKILDSTKYKYNLSDDLTNLFMLYNQLQSKNQFKDDILNTAAVLLDHGANPSKALKYTKENGITDMYNYLVKRFPTKRSPTRRSPTRRSPTRRSPTRRTSPRRSPLRRSPTRRSPPRRSARLSAKRSAKHS